MRVTTAEQRTRWNRTYYENGGKEKIRAAKGVVVERNLTYMREVKEAAGCADCQKPYPHYVLDFDHLPGCDKIRAVNHMARRGVSLKTLQEEIAKCEVVCANCHRTRTWQRSNADC